MGRMAEGSQDVGQTPRHGLVKQKPHSSGGDHGLKLDRACHSPRVKPEPLNCNPLNVQLTSRHSAASKPVSMRVPRSTGTPPSTRGSMFTTSPYSASTPNGPSESIASIIRANASASILEARTTRQVAHSARLRRRSIGPISRALHARPRSGESVVTASSRAARGISYQRGRCAESSQSMFGRSPTCVSPIPSSFTVARALEYSTTTSRADQHRGARRPYQVRRPVDCQSPSCLITPESSP